MNQSRHFGKPHIQIMNESVIHCEGSWTIPNLVVLDQILNKIRSSAVGEMEWDMMGVGAMDTGGAIVLYRTLTDLRVQGRNVSLRGLRPEFNDLIQLAESHWDQIHFSSSPKERPAQKITGWVSQQSRQLVKALEFIGETTMHVLRSLRQPWLLRWKALFHRLEVDGFGALPITGLLAFLMGVVIAYQGAEQLRQFGANIYVVDLVGVSLFREIAPLIVAILIAGRSGSAYAAQIGTMTVTEELDAIRTLGLSPISLLVLPRVFALVIAVPLLTVYADVLGVMGGVLIASLQLNVSGVEFVDRFEEAVALRHFLIGIGKAPWFGVIIALVGCYQGFRIRGSVDDVGRRTTIGVVQSIFLVIVFDAVCSIVFSWWNI